MKSIENQEVREKVTCDVEDYTRGKAQKQSSKKFALKTIHSFQ